jgi:hypothetical protein
MTDHEAFVEFRNGAVFVLTVLSLVALFAAIFLPDKSEPKGKFEVVDKYKGCDVVRYADPSTRWNYFLDCSAVNRT